MAKEEPIITEFKECPACKGTKRVGESLANEIKLRGLASPDFNFYVSKVQGVAFDPKMESKLPFGCKMPAITIFYDVCADCGCYYAAKVIRTNAEKQAQVNKPQIKGIPPGLILGNNPSLS